MNVYPAQQSIVSQLNAAFEAAGTSFLAKDLPDAPVDYQRGIVAPIVYVVYTGSKADPSVTTNTIAQPRKIAFTVEIHSRSLYQDAGMFAVRDLTERALIGFIPASCQRLYLIKDEITKTDENIWIHILQFECLTMLVQANETEEELGAYFREMYLKAFPGDTNPDQVIPVQ